MARTQGLHIRPNSPIPPQRLHLIPLVMNASQIKDQVSIPEYLRSMGIEPARTSPRGLMYHCPWRDDRHPSLSVTPDGHAWFDHSTGESGSVIDLAMKMLHTEDLAQVCAAFDTFSFHRSTPIVLDQRKEKERGGGGDAFASFNVVPLRSKKLLAYLVGRGIREDIARGYCQEAHYSFKPGDSFLYAVAFANDKGGYELRNERFKGAKSPKGITTHAEVFGVPMVVFEGFIDMLSFATMEGRRRHNYCVLNSVTNVGDAIERLATIQTKIYLCLDNDQAGREATASILSSIPHAQDISGRFAPYNDLNDFLTQGKSGGDGHR